MHRNLIYYLYFSIYSRIHAYMGLPNSCSKERESQIIVQNCFDIRDETNIKQLYKLIVSIELHINGTAPQRSPNKG